MPDNRKCIYYKKIHKKGYNYCLRNDTIRRLNCPCKNYKPKIIHKIKMWFEEVLNDNWW